MNATAVRFSFSGLYRKFDNMATKWVGKPCYLYLERLPTRTVKIHYSETPPYGYLGKTVSSLLRPLFLAARQNSHTFSCKKKRSLIRPIFLAHHTNASLVQHSLAS